MNREQRRKAAKTSRVMWPGGYVEVPSDSVFSEGEEFTLKGIQRLTTGEIIKDCQAGKETKWVAKKTTSFDTSISSTRSVNLKNFKT